MIQTVRKNITAYIQFCADTMMQKICLDASNKLGLQARKTGGWWTAALVIKLTSDVWSRVQVEEHVTEHA